MYSDIFALATEMLETTNPYKKELNKIYYMIGGKKIKLIDLVKEETDNSRRKPEYAAYSSIVQAMEIYLEDFQCSFSFKQKTIIKFKTWLTNIINKYELVNATIPPEFEISKNDTDICIAMLKELHSRDGISKEELESILDIKKRSVELNLRKISPELYDGENTDISEEAAYVPFRIGGQPVKARIKTIKRKGSRKSYYYTPNTVHPIVLQQNLMQIGVMLDSLCRTYYENESEMCLQIAMDVWSQLSDYAKDKIEFVFANSNKDLQEFIAILSDECPGDYAASYNTERDMMDFIELNKTEALRYVAKIPERKCTFSIETGNDELTLSHLRIIGINNESVTVLDESEREYRFKTEIIKDVIPE